MVPLSVQSYQRKAFTLLELILVMIILATVLTIAVPSLRGFFASRKINDVAEQIQIMTRYAKIQSISDSRSYFVNFDPQAKEYWVSTSNQDRNALLGNNFGKIHVIPSDIQMEFDHVPDQSGIYYLPFNPEGYTQACSVRLSDNRNNVLELICYSPSENFEIIEINHDKMQN